MSRPGYKSCPRSRNMSTGSQQQIKRNNSKRSQGEDDSFEQEHRLSPGYNQYFNRNASRLESKEISSRSGYNLPEARSPRGYFPPFYLNFAVANLPTELSTIKHISKHCRIGLFFGLYSTLAGKMNRAIWPIQLCALNGARPNLKKTSEGNTLPLSKWNSCSSAVVNRL